MSRAKYGRHLPAFILLFLAQQPSYGLGLLNKMSEQMPRNNADSAAIYRALRVLEEDNAVVAYWDTSEAGPAKKWYQITDIGLRKLADFKDDIEMRKQNMEFFLTQYNMLFDKE